VLGYAALPAFFVLYAERELGLGLGAAGALPLAFGAFVAVGMALAARVAQARVHRVLVGGAALLGCGLVAAGMTGALAVVGAALAVAALGAGLVTALGFPYFTRFVPAGEAGGYSGVFFAGRGVASAIALPLAGLTVEATGTYRSVLWLGAAALLALVPLLAAERRRSGAATPKLSPPPATVAAVIAVFASDRAAEVARAALRHVDEVVLVDDGAPREIARSLDPLARDGRVRLVPSAGEGGKGAAVATGVDLLLAGARRWIPDTQNGMRLFRTDCLRAVPMPAGGYESESIHLRALLKARRRVASVSIPTIYEGEPSHVRPLADTVRVARALLGPRWVWVGRIATAVAAALPLLQPLDDEF
jgi:Major Facilitator Superfamily